MFVFQRSEVRTDEESTIDVGLFRDKKNILTLSDTSKQVANWIAHFGLLTVNFLLLQQQLKPQEH